MQTDTLRSRASPTMSARYVAAAAAVAVGLGYYYYLRRRQPVVLITGASGYLGHHVLTALADDARYRLHGTFHGAEQFVARWARQCVCHRIALDDPAAVRSLVARVRPDVVIHLAAISSPAKAEADPARAKLINTPEALLDALPESSAVIFLSTDQVYDGERAPYTEADAPHPVNVYGRSKLDFEARLHERRPARSLSLRMSLLLGPPAPTASKRHSFLQDCRRMLATGTPHDFFSNEFRSVVYVDDVLACRASNMHPPCMYCTRASSHVCGMFTCMHTGARGAALGHRRRCRRRPGRLQHGRAAVAVARRDRPRRGPSPAPR